MEAKYKQLQGEDFYTVLMLSDWPVHAHKNILFLSCFEFYV